MVAPMFAIAVYFVLGVTSVQALIVLFFVPIAIICVLAVIVAINVQIVKLVIHNAIQIINI